MAVRRGAVLILLCTILAQLAPPAFAHYVLGRQTGSSPFRLRDFDIPGHVPGVTGYVWPGAGLPLLDPTNALVRSGNGVFTASPPGYQSPFTRFGPPTLQPLQEARDAYSPFGAILTSTSDHPNRGDLVFAINFTCPEMGCASIKQDLKFSNIAIYIPPELQPTVNWSGGDTSNVLTTVTNDYQKVEVRQADTTDAFGPNWWVVFVSGNIAFLKQHGFSEWYYFRLNGMIAPSVAGRYFFKIFINSTFPARSTVSDNGAVTPIFMSMPVENWPVLLVKGEEDPAILSGTIRYGGWNMTVYNRPIQVPGRVVASGVATDPATGRSTGRPVEAWGFFNASARGHYEVEGLAPGIYKVYVSAGGFPETLVADNLVVREGQSLAADFLVAPGPVVSGEIFSKKDFGEFLWPSRRPVYVEIYDNNAWANLGTPLWEQQHLKTFSPINWTAPPYMSYVYGNTVWKTTTKPFDTPPQPKSVAFPWEGPVSYYTYTSPSFSSTGPKDPFGVADGVGPAQVWWVDPTGFPTARGDPNSFALGSTPTTFRWQFGVEGLFGVPSDFDGHIPQALATWVDGLTAGTYYVRAWITQYVQTDESGVFVDYPFTIIAGEHPPDVFVPLDLKLGGSLNLTIHFHDLVGTLIDSPVGGPDPGRYIIAEAYDSSKHSLSAFNFTFLGSNNRTAFVTLSGLGMEGPNNIIAPGGAGTFGMMYSLLRYRDIRDYGIAPGSYSISIYMRGYVQEASFTFSATLTSNIHASLSMLRGAGINLTIYSKDFETPVIFRDWAWPGAIMFVTPFRSDGTDMGLIRFWNGKTWTLPNQANGKTSIPFPGSQSELDYNGSTRLELFGPDSSILPAPAEVDIEAGASIKGLIFAAGFLWNPKLYRDAFGISKVALPTDDYYVRTFTYGYIQEYVPQIYSTKGYQADSKVELTIGVNLTLLIKFKIEELLAADPFNMSMRVRVYDDIGQLVAASQSSNAFSGPFQMGSVPGGSTEVNWTIAGFNSYTDINQAHYPSYGISGMPEYLGGWTVELDTVNWYSPHEFFPPVHGLLLGESYHTIGGTDTGFVGNAYEFNHLGPWEQRNVITILDAPLSGEASVETSLDLRGLVRGTIVGATYEGDVRTISWAQINFTSPNITDTHYSYDGFYEAYLNPGKYNLTVTEWTMIGEGHDTFTYSILVPEGSDMEGLNVFLEHSGIAIPEVTGPNLSAMFTLAIFISTIYFRFESNEEQNVIESARRLNARSSWSSGRRDDRGYYRIRKRTPR